MLSSVTWADGLGFKHFGVRGLLLTDGLASMITAIALMMLLGNRLRKKQLEEAGLAALADS